MRKEILVVGGYHDGELLYLKSNVRSGHRILLLEAPKQSVTNPLDEPLTYEYVVTRHCNDRREWLELNPVRGRNA